MNKYIVTLESGETVNVSADFPESADGILSFYIYDSDIKYTLAHRFSKFHFFTKVMNDDKQ